MLIRRAVVLLAVAIGGCASAPSVPLPDERGELVSSAEMCAAVQCIHDVRILLKAEDGSVFDKTFDALPVVQDMGVFVYAGQMLYFEAEEEDGKLSKLKHVEQVTRPERTLSAKLEQDEKGHMLLVTTNPFKQNLRIRMGMMQLSSDRLERTSSCPVIAGGSSFEMWPYPIFQIVLGDMRLMEAEESMSCVE